MEETNTISKSFKCPSNLGKDTLYNNRKKEVEIWESFRSLPKEKRVLATIMTLTGEAEEAVLKMEINELTEWC